MLPVIIFRECIGCGKLLSRIDWGSPLETIVWTDSKTDNLLQMGISEIACCPECGQYLWLEDVAVLGSPCLFYYNKEEWKGALPMVELDVTDLAELLEADEKISIKRSRSLRLLIWWKLNNPYRTGKRSAILPPIEEELFFANLKRLDQLLDVRNLDHLIMKAEIARECGEFEKCIARLTEIPVKYVSASKLKREKIRKYALDQYPVVQKL